MADRIQKIVTELPGLKSVTGVWKVADGRLAQGDAVFLADLGIALAGTYGSDPRPIWQYGSVFDHLLRVLATPGPGNVAQALRLVSSAEAGDRELDRYAASLLASSHPAEELTDVFIGHASEELRACLVQTPKGLRRRNGPHRTAEAGPCGGEIVFRLMQSALQGSDPIPGL